MSRGRRVRSRRTIALAGVAALAAAITFFPTASYGEPTLDEVEDRVSRLYHQSEQAQERLNAVKEELSKKRQRLQALRTDLTKQERHFRALSDEVAAMVAQQAQSPDATLSAAHRLILAKDDNEFLDHLAATQALNGRQGELLAELERESKKLDLRREQMRAELTDLKSDRKQIADERQTVEDNLAEAEDLLAELEAEQRESLQVGHSETQVSRDERPAMPTGSGNVSGNAQAAVDYALAQVGKAYAYGATGPDAYDCSGLTMAAWAAAGVSLPHSSTGQYGSGTPVSSSELQPGDLVFYYDPISHVGMYIGNGQIVHAANPSTGVTTTSLYSMPYSGAVRVG